MGGLLTSCCGTGEESEQLQPDPEIRRRQMAEAAERRAQEAESRGIKNADKIKRMQKKADELEKLEQASSFQQKALKWQV